MRPSSAPPRDYGFAAGPRNRTRPAPPPDDKLVQLGGTYMSYGQYDKGLWPVITKGIAKGGLNVTRRKPMCCWGSAQLRMKNAGGSAKGLRESRWLPQWGLYPTRTDSGLYMQARTTFDRSELRLAVVRRVGPSKHDQPDNARHRADADCQVM